MRNSYAPSLYHKQITSNADCTQSSISDQEFNLKKCSYSSGSHSFTNCVWNNNGRTSNGGAIHYVLTDETKRSSASLAVDDCTFLHCHDTGTVDGGAVYAKYIGSASVSDSRFYYCECGSAPGQEGAGICLGHLYTNPSIVRCTFISCTTADDGGGCGIWYSKSSIIYAVDSCCFVNCIGIGEEKCQGGGIAIIWNEDFMTCTNCFLFACEAKSEGGGIWVMCPAETSPKPITFCFFSENEAGEGKDVFLYGFPTSSQHIIHSFTCESVSGRVSGSSDNWLPQGRMSFPFDCSTLSGTLETKRNDIQSWGSQLGVCVVSVEELVSYTDSNKYILSGASDVV